MGIDFDSMKGKAKTLYRAMWDNEDFLIFQGKIRKTIWRGGESDNSYSFDVGDDTEKGLMNIFEIDENSPFSRKYRAAVSGDGREEGRISVLHSSALCALLFFYNVTPDHPLRLTVNGENTEFTDAEFEYKNKVINDRLPSNVDVVLISGDRKIVLFLESKFSEYYKDCGKSIEFSRDYLDGCRYSSEVYGNSALLKEMGLIIRGGENEKKVALVSEETAYLEGVKQMVSHYVGIRNLIDSASAQTGTKKGSLCERDVDVEDVVRNGAKIYLGEILFDHKIGELENVPGKPCFEAYETMVQKLAHGLNACIEKDRLSDRFYAVENLFRYSELSDREFINDRIRKFYFGK